MKFNIKIIPTITIIFILFCLQSCSITNSQKGALPCLSNNPFYFYKINGSKPPKGAIKHYKFYR